jgi:hypothetical protein
MYKDEKGRDSYKDDDDDEDYDDGKGKKKRGSREKHVNPIEPMLTGSAILRLLTDHGAVETDANCFGAPRRWWTEQVGRNRSVLKAPSGREHHARAAVENSLEEEWQRRCDRNRILHLQVSHPARTQATTIAAAASAAAALAAAAAETVADEAADAAEEAGDAAEEAGDAEEKEKGDVEEKEKGEEEEKEKDAVMADVDEGEDGSAAAVASAAVGAEEQQQLEWGHQLLRCPWLGTVRTIERADGNDNDTQKPTQAQATSQARAGVRAKTR